MLYVIHRANHPELAYRGGQGPIIHLEADLREVAAWADGQGRRWAFSLSNAAAYYAEFRTGFCHLHEVNWNAVAATDFRSEDIKEGKQAEFLLHHSFPWHLVSRIGVLDRSMAISVAQAMSGASHRPTVEVKRDWYYQGAAAMIRFARGDILASHAEALVNSVNCVGIMGRGIALQFRNAFPENYKAYEAACRRLEVQPGKMFVFETHSVTNPKLIINFPTKRHWRGDSRMEDIAAGLVALVQEIRARGVRSIAVPPLGSGLGGLNWSEVRPRIEAALSGVHGLEATIYEPTGTPDSRTITRTKAVPEMTAGRAALVVLIHKYLGGLMDPFVSLLEVHKLMYFMQTAGQQLRLRFAKGPYGPYAENLRHVLRAVEGHFISGYADGGDAPSKQIELVPGAIDDAQAFLKDHRETSTRFDRVADLVEGFETPFGLELLSTLHWVATRDGVTDLDAVAKHVYAWNERKARFSRQQIRIAYEVLRSKGWLAAA